VRVRVRVKQAALALGRLGRHVALGVRLGVVRL